MQRPPWGAVVLSALTTHHKTELATIGNYGPANITANIFAASGHCRGCVGVQTNRGDRAQLVRRFPREIRLCLCLAGMALIAPSAAQ